jgi:hypothetical protein
MWDSSKSAFVLNIGVDQTATLKFSNFDHTPSAYAGGALLKVLTPVSGGYELELSPGSYLLVIR